MGCSEQKSRYVPGFVKRTANEPLAREGEANPTGPLAIVTS